ncbi:hypothetical protein MASR1M107_03470 [Ignavibacteriales bacterium]
MDKTIYLVHSRDWSYPYPATDNYYVSFSDASNYTPVYLDSIVFYKGSLWATDRHFGMKEDENKVYYYREGAKYLMFDFSLTPTASYRFISPFDGTERTMVVTGDSATRVFKFTYSNVWGAADASYTFVRNFGLIKTYGSTRDHESTAEYVELVRFSKTGDSLYTTTSAMPVLGFSPKDTFANPAGTFRVGISHTLNEIVQPYQTAFQFNDTFYMDYYYSSDADSTPVQTVSYSATFSQKDISIPFDTILQTPGYRLKYRFRLTDKRYRPITVYKPADHSFYSITYTGSVVGLGEEDILGSEKESFRVSLYPNPVADVLTVECHIPEVAQTVIEIFDVTGKRLYYSSNENEVNEVNTRINIRELGLASGIYFLRTSSTGKRNYTKTAKFLVW